MQTHGSDDATDNPVKLKSNSQGAGHIVDGNMVPLGFDQILITAVAKGLDEGEILAAIPADARLAWLQIQGTDDVRWTDDGTTPTASIGMLFESTDPDIMYAGDLSTIQFIEVSGAPQLNVSFYK